MLCIYVLQLRYFILSVLELLLPQIKAFSEILSTIILVEAALILRERYR